LGFEGVEDMRVGKSMRFTIDADSADVAQQQAEDMCSRFLTNPVIEDAAVIVAAA